MLIKCNNKTVKTIGDAGGIAFNKNEHFLNEFKHLPYPRPVQYLEFSAATTQTISLSNTGGNHPIVLYSFNKAHWEEWDYSPITFPSGGKIYFAGYNSSGFSSRESWSTFVLSNNTQTVVKGDVMSLLDGKTHISTIPNEGCFKRLFYNCEDLYVVRTTDAKTPFDSHIMNVDILKPYCCEEMFAGCKHIFGMSLGASQLAEGCYYGMFSGCSSFHFIEILTPLEGYGKPNMFTQWLTQTALDGTVWYKRSTAYIWEGEKKNGNVPSRWVLEVDPNAG